MKVEDSTLAVVRAFERMGIRHYVCGSLASSLHGEPKGRFFVDKDDFNVAVRTERSFNLIAEIELAKVDVFCVRAQGYQGEALNGIRLCVEMRPCRLSYPHSPV